MSHEKNRERELQAFSDMHRTLWEQEPPNRKALRLLETIIAFGWAHEPLPGWVLDEVERVFERVALLEVGGLDEAFGLKPETPGRLAQKREANRVKWAGWSRIMTLKKEGRPIPWADLAEEIGTSEGTLKRAYYSLPETILKNPGNSEKE